MRAERESSRQPAQIFIHKAMTLSSSEAELLGQRMRGRFARRREDKLRSAIEILALQLEFEDHQLRGWRNSLAKIRGTRKVAMDISLQQRIIVPIAPGHSAASVDASATRSI